MISETLQAWLGIALVGVPILMILLAGQGRHPLLFAGAIAVLMGSAIGMFQLGWLLIPGLYYFRRLYPSALRAWTIPAAIAVAAPLIALKLPWPLHRPPGPTAPAQAIVKQVDLMDSVYFYRSGSKYGPKRPHYEDLPVPVQVVLLDLTPAGHGPLFARDMVDSGSVAGLAPGATVPIELSSADRGAARLAGGTRSFGWRALLHFLLRTCLWGAFWTLVLMPVARWLRRNVRPVPSGAAALLLLGVALGWPGRAEARQRTDTLPVLLVDVSTARAIAGESVTVESDNGIRCIRAPCPTNRLTWTGRSDATGTVRVPAAVVQPSTSVRVGDRRGELDPAARSTDGALRVELFPAEGEESGPRYIRLVHGRTGRPLTSLRARIEYSGEDGRPARLDVTSNAIGYVPVPYDVVLGADQAFVVAKGFRRTPLDVTPGPHRTLLEPE